MIIECPHCGAKHNLDEKALAGKNGVQGKCTKCQRSFSVATPTTVAPAYGSAAAAQPAPAIDQTRVSPQEGEGGQLPEGKTVALSVTAGPTQGQVFRLDKPKVTIGRSGTDLVILDPEISRKHCSLVVNGTAATLTDLGTTNGTFVNGERVSSRELHHLSEFHIGASTVLFTVTAAEAGDKPS